MDSKSHTKSKTRPQRRNHARERELGVEAHVQRLKAFNELLVRVNQAMNRYDDDGQFLKAICDLSVIYNEIKLAWVATVRDGSDFSCIAASGATEALHDIKISTEATSPWLAKLMTRAWHTGEPTFVQSYAQHDTLSPWKAWARRFGMRAMAVLPLYRNGKIWAVWTVYHEKEGVFDSEMQTILEQIALDITRGLERIDLVARERQSAIIRESLLNNALVGILMTQGKRIVEANEHVARMFGYRGSTEIIGQSPLMFYANEEAFERIRTLYPDVYTRTSVQVSSVRLKRKDGSIICCDVSGSHAKALGNRTVVWTLVDVTLREQLQRRVRFEALHDALTTLPNRRALDNTLQDRIDRADERGHKLAVCMIDLDKFKGINDSFGHEAGDQVLRQISHRLSERLRGGDFIARLGGDEFILVLDYIPANDSYHLTAKLLDRVHQVVEEPLKIDNKETVQVGLSLGIALYPDDAQSAADLVRKADSAMYAAKARHTQFQPWWAYASSTGVWDSVWERDALDAEDSREALYALESYVEGTAREFVHRFYREIATETFPKRLFRHMSPREVSGLMQSMTDHLKFLMAPATTRSTILERAHQLGRIHALCGVSPVWLSRSQQLYSETLIDQLRHEKIPKRLRAGIMRVCNQRLQVDMEIQFEEQSKLHQEYLKPLTGPSPERGVLWADISKDSLHRVASLPGIKAALLMRGGSDGKFVVEARSGVRGRAIASLLSTEGKQIDLRSTAVSSARAWQGVIPTQTVSFYGEPAYEKWQERLYAWGVRSSMSVPITDQDSERELVLTLFGAYPNQFGSKFMARFANGLRYRWEQLWSIANRREIAVGESKPNVDRQL